MTQKIQQERDAWEFHRWQGFTRFRAGPDGRLIARIAPSCDILADLAAYFSRRLAAREWVLLDETRQRAAVCAKDGCWHITPWQNIDTGCVSDEIESLWKTYFDTIEIRERHNPSLQKKYVPERYRSYLVEYQE